MKAYKNDGWHKEQDKFKRGIYATVSGGSFFSRFAQACFFADDANFRRFLIALSLFIGGFFLSLRGWLNLNDERRFIAAAYILSGLGLSCFGLFLLW
jgi:hypothetical protein